MPADADALAGIAATLRGHGYEPLAHLAEEVIAERDGLRAIFEGSAEPPTDAEVLAHSDAGGHWLVARESPGPRTNADFAVFSMGIAWVPPKLIRRVWPIDSTGRLCARPVVPQESFEGSAG